MDTPPRSAFLAGIVEPHERTAMMGFVNISRSSLSSFSPLVTGVLAGKKMLWVAFVIAGSLLVTYDLGILAIFGGHKEKNKAVDEESDGEIVFEDNTDITGTLGEAKAAKETRIVTVEVLDGNDSRKTMKSKSKDEDAEKECVQS